MNQTFKGTEDDVLYQLKFCCLSFKVFSLASGPPHKERLDLRSGANIMEIVHAYYAFPDLIAPKLLSIYLESLHS